MIHELKIKPEYFASVVSGDKTFEIRNNADRNFQVGDTLRLKAWDGEFTGDFVEKVVSYITDFEQKPGYVVMGLQKQHETPAADWREAGEHDPFGDRYNCDRDALPMGNITDDALANQLFVCDHRHDMQSITLLTAGKERIRWLSRQLESRKQHEHELLANHRKMLIEKSELCDDLLDLIERMVSYMGMAGDEPEKDSYNPMKAWMYDAITTMAGQRPKQSVAVTETIRTAPERIWLQVGDQAGDGDYQFPEHHDEVTWCADSVVACEVPYVRADLVGKQPDPWLPIETAPRDGRKALVYRPLAENSGDERIAVKRLTGGQSNNCWDKTVPPGATPCNPTDGACHVTHWMPLPDEPAQQGGEPCATEPPSSSPA
ncbi:ASCH/PUA domain-containing protein [Aeromonas jandaei]|uniref:ASCH/PUA domain-containing protein n=1 Tax=Aeromonas jandaei TaxID=650 RepID=UPI003D1AF597